MSISTLLYSFFLNIEFLFLWMRKMHPKSLDCFHALTCSLLYRNVMSRTRISENFLMVSTWVRRALWLRKNEGSDSSCINMVGVPFKLLFSIFWVFKKFSSITSVGFLLEFLFLEVLLCYGIAFVFSCYALGAQKCLTVSIHSTARLALAIPAFPKNNCSFFAYESSATLHEFEFICSETRCLWHTS
jgi:hypothetical protein